MKPKTENQEIVEHLVKNVWEKVAKDKSLKMEVKNG